MSGRSVPFRDPQLLINTNHNFHLNTNKTSSLASLPWRSKGHLTKIGRQCGASRLDCTDEAGQEVERQSVVRPLVECRPLSLVLPVRAREVDPPLGEKVVRREDHFLEGTRLPRTCPPTNIVTPQEWAMLLSTLTVVAKGVTMQATARAKNDQISK